MDSSLVKANELADGFVRLANYRQKLFAEIARAIDVYEHWKSYEGEIALRMPGALTAEKFVLAVLCYVAAENGSERQFVYEGRSLAECVDLAEADLQKWIQETDEFIARKASRHAIL